MSLTLKYLLDKRSAKQNGKYPLKIRLIYNRSSAHISTGFYLSENEWDKRNERLKATSKFVEDTARFNNKLITKKAKYNDAITKLLEQGLTHLKAKDFKDRITKKTSTSTNNFFDFLSKEIEDLKEAKRFGTASSYNDLYNKIKSFNREDMSLTFTEINYAFLKDLEKVHLSKGSSLGSLGVYMRTLRALYNKAIKSGVARLEDYPFKHYTIKRAETKRNALTEQDLRKIINPKKKYKDVIEHARLFYLLSFYLQGMNWMDMCLLKGENISRDNSRIQYKRHKTGKAFSIKLFPQAIKIIEQLYGKSFQSIKKNEYILPVNV